jgi:hypothetical protein
MKLQPSPGAACTDPITAPTSVRVLRTLGQGRAAQAQLVEAFMPDGRVLKCVEKVFAPGLLTRTIYRLSFQSPFAYQSNRDAILACFYRRLVAAAVLAASDIDASIAHPLYVRFDKTERAWVLAAEWIDGRGIKPAAADDSRIRRWISGNESQPKHDEIDELVGTMGRLEQMLADCGLVGSGWQVAPRALVSTANLLRTDDHYTIIDLESGIPAVLVPRYLLAGLRSAALPPFDDLNADKLRSWIRDNERLLTFRIGPDGLAKLRDDSAKLIKHSSRWKDSEFALFRRPWRLLTECGTQSYQQECFRRWQQDGVVDTATADSLGERPIKSRMIWYSGLLPSSLGRFCSRLIGRRDYREHASKCLRDRETRITQWQSLVQDRQTRWVESGRIPASTKLTTASVILNGLLQKTTPSGLHRFISDAKNRRDVGTILLLLLFSSRYQAWFGQNRIDSSIDRWAENKRITDAEAAELRDNLLGKEVRAYTRGFGMHLALKALAPIILPAKIGGVAAFLANGNLWFLLPMLATPVMRTSVTLANWSTTRHEHIPHGEALVTGWLPIVGSVAFPLQMFASRPKLSTFLIRDTASKLGRRVPVYGGADSRTEIAFIRASDLLVEFMQSVSSLTQSLLRSAPTERSDNATRTHKIQPRTRFGRWIDRQAGKRIAEADQQNLRDAWDEFETRAA